MALTKKVSRVEIRNEMIHIEFGIFDGDKQIGSDDCWNYNQATRWFMDGDANKAQISAALGDQLSGFLAALQAEIPPQ